MRMDESDRQKSVMAVNGAVSDLFVIAHMVGT